MRDMLDKATLDKDKGSQSSSNLNSFRIKSPIRKSHNQPDLNINLNL